MNPQRLLQMKRQALHQEPLHQSQALRNRQPVTAMSVTSRRKRHGNVTPESAQAHQKPSRKRQQQNAERAAKASTRTAGGANIVTAPVGRKRIGKSARRRNRNAYERNAVTQRTSGNYYEPPPSRQRKPPRPSRVGKYGVTYDEALQQWRKRHQAMHDELETGVDMSYVHPVQNEWEPYFTPITDKWRNVPPEIQDEYLRQQREYQQRNEPSDGQVFASWLGFWACLFIMGGMLLAVVMAAG